VLYVLFGIFIYVKYYTIDFSVECDAILDPLFYYVMPPEMRMNIYIRTMALIYPFVSLAIFREEIEKIQRILKKYLLERGYCVTKKEFTCIMLAWAMIGCISASLFANQLQYTIILYVILVILTIILGEPIEKLKEECSD